MHQSSQGEAAWVGLGAGGSVHVMGSGGVSVPRASDFL